MIKNTNHLSIHLLLTLIFITIHTHSFSADKNAYAAPYDSDSAACAAYSSEDDDYSSSEDEEEGNKKDITYSQTAAQRTTVLSLEQSIKQLSIKEPRKRKTPNTTAAAQQDDELASQLQRNLVITSSRQKPYATKPPAPNKDCFICIPCFYRFTTEDAYHEHMTTEHPTIMDDDTQHNFPEAHKRRLCISGTGTDEKKITRKSCVNTCENCCEQFSSRKEIDQHVGQCAKTSEFFRCKEPGCNKTFYTKKRLESHKNSHEKTYICTICNKSFSRHSQLEKHFTTHTGEKNHTCATCGKSFFYRSSLSMHMKSSHKAV